MREIKFRGKSLKDGKWYYGYFLVNRIGEHTICDNNFAVAVISKTVGQFIGLLDRDKTEIYEGDIVSAEGGESYYGAREFVKTITINNLIYDTYELSHYEDLKVIGNIYENEELLAGVK